MAQSRTFALIAGGGIAAAALLAVIGHLDSNGGMDPWTLTVSDFAVSDRGGAIDIAMGLVAFATVVAVAGLWRAGIAIGAWATGLLAVWTGGVLLSAVVPTDEPGLPLSTAGAVHRYASIAAFLALPVGGWLLTRRLPSVTAGRWIRGLAVASLVCALGMAGSAFLADRLLIGLIERLLIAAEIGLLGIIVASLVPVRSRRLGVAGLSVLGDAGLSALRGAGLPASGVADPSTTGSADPSTTGDAHPAPTGSADPAATDANPSTTGDAHPAATGVADPSTTGSADPSTTDDTDPAADADVDPSASEGEQRTLRWRARRSRRRARHAGQQNAALDRHARRHLYATRRFNGTTSVRN